MGWLIAIAVLAYLVAHWHDNRVAQAERRQDYYPKWRRKLGD